MLQPDQDRPGQAEGARGAKIVSVNPVRTGYSAIADEWIGIRPGTDGLFVGALIHELLRTEDRSRLPAALHQRALAGVRESRRRPMTGCSRATRDGKPLAWDRARARSPGAPPDGRPKLVGRASSCPMAAARCRLPADGRTLPRRPNGRRSGGRTLRRPADTIRRIAAETRRRPSRRRSSSTFPGPTSGPRHEKMVGRPVSMHAMRGISAHSNGFQTCRALHLLQILLGAIDVPGGFRYKPPFPRRRRRRPARRQGPPSPTRRCRPPLGFVTARDLLVDADGNAAAHRQGL
jgi:sulfite dehydrogenase (quinone) subunit SoeA